MKTQSIKLLLSAVLFVMAANSRAQLHKDEVLQLGAVAPYEIEVTYDKTSHIIFPSGIRYVDLGSDYIVAGKAEDADNVLRVKAAVPGFDLQTNFSVITEDGNFYGFDVCYSDAPLVLGHNLAKGTTLAARSRSGDVQFEALGKNPASLTGLLMEALYEKNKRAIRNLKSEGYGITLSVKGIYVHEGKYYFHIQLDNMTNIPFAIDFLRFTVVDRKVAKRTVVQERALDALKTYRPLLSVPGNRTERNIFLLDVFTLTKGQVLHIEVVEKNGGRGQVVTVKNADLLDAQPLEKLHLKF